MMIVGGLAHLAASLAYVVGFGYLGALSAWQEWKREHQFTVPCLLGLGIVGMAATAGGPHHFQLGLTSLNEVRPTLGVDVLTIGVALPFALLWLWLRTEAAVGGEGDRSLSTGWGRATAGFILVYSVSVFIVALYYLNFTTTHLVEWLPQLVEFGLFAVIGFLMWFTQRRLWRATRKWSLAGLCLAAVFPTGAVTHLVYGVEISRGLYHAGWPFWIFDILAVPFGLLFLVVAARNYDPAAVHPVLAPADDELKQRAIDETSAAIGELQNLSDQLFTLAHNIEAARRLHLTGDAKT